MIKPLISVIIPIYNVESYLEDAIKSVINQSIGFKKNIELILVNDGSTDGSGVICEEYASKYPENITYKKVKNGGVSKARNIGYSLATGKYIHFLDGDDIISRNFYKKSIDFLSKNSSEVDFVASKLMFFDEIIDSHPLNYKFNKTRVIDLSKEPESPILHVISCVFIRDSIENVKFDESLSIAEDIKFISDVLLRRKKYGVLSDTTYHYRKRGDGTSAIERSRKIKASYIDVVEGVYGHMFNDWNGDNSFAESTILYDLSYRLDQDKQSTLSLNDEKAYIKSVFSLISNISDKAIISTKFLSVNQKIFLLKRKYGKDFSQYVDVLDFWDPKSATVFLDFIEPLGGDRYKVEGYIKGINDIDSVEYFMGNGDVTKKIKFTDRAQLNKSFLGHIYERGMAFEVDINLMPESCLSIRLNIGDAVYILPIETGRYTKLGALKWTYRRDKDRLLKKTNKGIVVYDYSAAKHIKLELRIIAQILLNWRFGTLRKRFAMLRSRNLKHLSIKNKIVELLKPFAFSVEAVVYIPRDILLRISYYVAKKFKKRSIWLISDRSMAARDNGEAIFRYIMSLKDCPANVYFVMSKKSKDLERIKKIGPVLYQESLHFKLKFLLSDKIIASQADIETTNPFIRLMDRYVDLFNFDFIFLQHGIIRHNLSSWLNRFEKNIDLFITSADKEYQSILTNPYYYSENKVLLSGLARYDYLINKPAGKLILAPTYRKNLVKMKTDRVGRRNYDPTFKNSAYREFYNNFINDPRLLEALEENKMKGEFYLHPVFSEQRVDFDENEHFKLMNFPYDYQKAFKEGNLLVSDHSSVVFDFAYLKKPVLYAHFDVETFFEGHSYDESNFFSDEDDGFGEVCYDYDSLVEKAIDSINKGCLMSEKYISRVDKFFYKTDKENSRRIYEAIVNMKSNEVV